ncbi:tryptophan-rich sensory protein [Aliishimia ponticola]|uniref:Tryptophan-rich sensory protein n=1 Tax=Aliishimia ponticola TaxID=2499833 RepID=A0A4S4NFA3_9RHOB|nr:tryptophan-rich sensory protein [Aliishimia ponticola]THH38254.1 tryptophan-rich sensory protein [Aliishimia ponticola]
MLAAVLTLVVTLAFAVSPFLVPGFNGFSPEQFPIPQNDPPVQPAGYAFSIWGLIYLWLIASAVFGLWLRRDDPDWAEMRPALILSLAIGAAWLPVAQQNPPIATVMIWAMWLTAVAALMRSPRDDRGIAAWPVGLYAGWLTAASCVALGLCLAGYGIVSERIAALAMLGLALVLAVAIQWKLGRAPGFGLAVVWALIGVFVANRTPMTEITMLAVAGAALVLFLALVAAFRDWRSSPV